MALPDRAEVVQRFDEVDRRLNAALAFSRLLADLHKDDQHARQLTEEAQAALADLKEGRKALEVFAGRGALRQVREAEIGCKVVLAQLGEKDHALKPSALRRCLRRLPGFDPHQLADLLSFYVHLERQPPWSSDRVDKVDLLLTQLSQRLTDPQSEPGSQRLNRILAASHLTVEAEITDLERRSFGRNLAAIEAEVEAADSLGQLIDSGTLKKYRNLKHRLGHLLLHPDLLREITETNHALQRKIRRLNSRTLTGIFSVYQGIFETGLKGKIDNEMKDEFDQLHLDFARFETRVKRDEIRLTELEELWSTLTTFSARLDEAAAVEEEAPAPPHGRESVLPGDSADDWLAEDLMALLDLLRENDRKRWPPEYVSFSPREEFQLDPREIVAFRRLGDEEADQTLENFLLKAAALRRSIKRSARRLAGVKDSETFRELPDFPIAQQAVRLAESFLARYSQAVEQAILDADVSEAQKLQILRMRLVRESAGIWLQVYQHS